MPITRTAMIDDDGSGTTGTIFNNAWKQEFYNQIDGGPPVINAALNPADFTANNGATWTVTGASLSYLLAINGLLYLAVHVISSTITGAPTNLFIRLPQGLVGKVTATGATYVTHGAAVYEVGVSIAHADSRVALYRPAIGQFGAGPCTAYTTIAVLV